MSQQTMQLQPPVVNDESQERKKKFYAESYDSISDTASTGFPFLCPGRLDLYVLRQFLFLFFEITLLFSIVYVVMDFLNSSDVFIQKCHQHQISLPVAMFKYYMPRLLIFFDALLSVCVILPTIILVNQMIRRKETIALASMGIRRVRIAYMIFGAAIVLIVLFALCREYILPSQRSIIGCDINSFFEQDRFPVEPKTDPMTSVYINGEALDLAHKTIIHPVFNMPVINLDQYGQKITAEVAQWQPAKLENDSKNKRLAGFLLKNVVAEKNLDDQSSLTINGNEILITPLNNPWLNKGECFLVSGIEIEDLTLNSELLEYSSTSELQRIMERMPPNQRMDAAIILHKRIVRPLIDLCIIFVGMSFILGNENRLLIILIKVAIWWLSAWIVINISSSLVGEFDKAISPAMAAWIPLIFCSAMVAYVWDRVFY